MAGFENVYRQEYLSGSGITPFPTGRIKCLPIPGNELPGYDHSVPPGHGPDKTLGLDRGPTPSRNRVAARAASKRWSAHHLAFFSTSDLNHASPSLVGRRISTRLFVRK